MEHISIAGDPLIEIARAIGRLESMLESSLKQHDNHEQRIGSLEVSHTKFKTYITVIGTLAGGAVSLGAWVLEHLVFKS